MRAARRGQVLVLVALTISLAIISTQAYIYQRSQRRRTPEWGILSDYVLGINQGSKHVIISSLINITRGGSASNLEANLYRWTAFVSRDYQIGRCDLSVTRETQAPYSEGTWIDWVTPGRGVSSASANITLKISGRGADIGSSFKANITTSITISGWYSTILGDQKNVTVTLKLLNEGEPALAENIELWYFNQTGWENLEELTSFEHRDFGNGTYQYSFTDSISTPTVQVRADVYDRRGIFLQAKAELGEG